MGKLFCLMGKSSTGKDTIYKRLLQDERLDIKRVVSYTTRPIRAHETEGEEYHFCTPEEEKELEDRGKIIEKRTYHTVYGPWDYFTVDDGAVDLKDHDYLMIGTPDAYVSLCDYYSKDAVVPIYIKVEDGIRLERALKRERNQKNPKYEEMCRRFLGDAKDFSDERLKACDIRNVFVNDDLDRTVKEIGDFIWRSK